MKNSTVNRENIRSRVLEAAFNEFSAKGFNDARINSIADDAGINPSQIYYYLGNKENLYKLTVNRAFELLADSYLHPVFSYLKKNYDEPDLKLAILLYSLSLLNDDPAFKKISRLYMRDTADGITTTAEYGKMYCLKYLYQVEDILDEGIKKGIFEISAPSLLVMNIFTLMKSSTMQAFPGREIYPVLIEFIFKSLTPAGRITETPILDYEKKKTIQSLINYY